MILFWPHPWNIIMFSYQSQSGNTYTPRNKMEAQNEPCTRPTSIHVFMWACGKSRAPGSTFRNPPLHKSNNITNAASFVREHRAMLLCILFALTIMVGSREATNVANHASGCCQPLIKIHIYSIPKPPLQFFTFTSIWGGCSACGIRILIPPDSTVWANMGDLRRETSPLKEPSQPQHFFKFNPERTHKNYSKIWWFQHLSTSFHPLFSNGCVADPPPSRPLRKNSGPQKALRSTSARRSVRSAKSSRSGRS